MKENGSKSHPPLPPSQALPCSWWVTGFSHCHKIPDKTKGEKWFQRVISWPLIPVISGSVASQNTMAEFPWPSKTPSSHLLSPCAILQGLEQILLGKRERGPAEEARNTRKCKLRTVNNPLCLAAAFQIWENEKACRGTLGIIHLPRTEIYSSYLSGMFLPSASLKLIVTCSFSRVINCSVQTLFVLILCGHVIIFQTSHYY